MTRLSGSVFYFNILVVTWLASVCSCLGQTNPEQITEIRKEFQTINADTTLKKITVENEEFLGDNIGDGGGKLTGFYKKKSIKKIVLWLGLSTGTEIKEYYFKEDQLIFVYEKFNSFEYDEKKGQMDYNTSTTTFEGRYYFHNQKLIDKTLKGKNRHDDEVRDPEIFIDQGIEHAKLLNKKYNAS